MDIQLYLRNLKELLLHEDNWQCIALTRSWANEIPDAPGVYALRDGDTVVYVGETGNLRGRMRDLLDSRNHSVRIAIGERLFAATSGYIKASSRKKFPDHIEQLVNAHFCNNMKVAVLVVTLGRKELEELIQNTIDVKAILNKRGKRK